MKLNQHTVIEGDLVYLVPYEECHVEKYHSWMQSVELRNLTASEPLTLEQEFEMQKKWREDPDKCTFIVLCKSTYNETKDEIAAMIGDTNIFLQESLDVAEVEIMIAEDSARRRGFGKEAVLMMIRYGITHLNLKILKAIILNDNFSSISLFKKIGFDNISENKVFNELVFAKEVSKEWFLWLKTQTPIYKEIER